MSLSVALNSALSGLKVNQESLSVIANNVANANNENYTRRIVAQSSVNIAGVGQGVEIEEIIRNVDEFLVGEIRTQESLVKSLDSQERFYNLLQIKMGNPDNGSSISATIEEFFNSLKLLSNNPELSSQRLNAVNKGIDLATRISGFANEIEDLRLQADREIVISINRINSLINSIYETNIAIAKANNTGQPTASFTEDRDNLLKELAGEIDMSVLFGQRGEAYIQTGKGLSLLDSNRRQLSYSSVASKNVFINDDSNYINPIEIITIDESGSEIGSRQEIVTGGLRDEIVSQIRGGRLHGLLKMRDEVLPTIIDHLDNFVSEFTEQFNAIHNTGSGFPPKDTLIGTTPISRSSETTYTGKVRIGLVQEDGSPILSPYTDETYLKPLTLDLGALNSGSGAGRVNTNTILDEINEYFGPPQKRVSMGDFYDIRMVSLNNGISANGSFTFDFEVENTAATNSTFKVTGVTVNNGAAGLSSALPSDTIVLPGERKRTGNSATVDFTGGSGSPYTITVDIEAEDADGIITTDSIDFLVADNVSGILNDRYITSDTTTPGDATILNPLNYSRFMTASLVNSDDNVIALNSIEAGYLKLATNNTSYKIVIDDLTSQETGLSTQTVDIDATNRGFSHYFGLNNFFTITEDSTKRSAINMAVRSDFASSPNLISMGNYRLSPQPSDDTEPPVYTYEISIGGNEVISNLADLSVVSVTFASTGLLPTSTSTFNQYVSDIISSASILSSNNTIILRQEEAFQNSFLQQERSNSGVSLDEELARSIVYQNAYAGNAKIISVTKELFDILFQAI